MDSYIYLLTTEGGREERILTPYAPLSPTGHVVTYIESLVCHPNILSVAFRGFSPSRGPRSAEIFGSFLSLLLGLLD
jgi:hypothetical protein